MHCFYYYSTFRSKYTDNFKLQYADKAALFHLEFFDVQMYI